MRKRTATVVAGVLALVLAGLIAVLATRDPATTRQVRSPLLGHAAPTLAGDLLLDDGTFDLQAEEGRFVIVNFFASWCDPCKAEHDDLKRFQETHTELGDASVVSVVFGDNTKDAQAFFDKRGGDWPVVSDGDGAIATAWGVIKVPESYLVAPDGTVLAKLIGGVRFEDLEALLAKVTA